MLSLPNNELSLWRSAYDNCKYQSLNSDIQVDVAIIGGGISGLTSAYLLKQAGLKVAVLEKRTIGAGTTARTTGKVTSQHNLIYNKLQRRHGHAVAQSYADANQAALQLVESIIKKENIACNWKREDNYVFTTDPRRVESFKSETEVAQQLGLPASFEANSPLPFDTSAAVKFSNQASFHSQRYLLGLAEAIYGKGSYIFENSNVTSIKDGSPARVKSNGHTVSAKDVIVATSVPTLPLVARGAYCLLEYPTESYIVAARLPEDRQLTGMYISPDNSHYSILPVNINGENLLLIGGGGHVSGRRLRKKAHYQPLADYAEGKFGATSIAYHWSDRDYLGYDDVPLIGKLYGWSKHLYVATAMMKWGLTNGTVAGMILRDQITGQNNQWAHAFSSTRKRPVAAIPRTAVEHIPRPWRK